MGAGKLEVLFVLKNESRPCWVLGVLGAHGGALLIKNTNWSYTPWPNSKRKRRRRKMGLANWS